MPFERLGREQFMSLTTFRRTGEPVLHTCLGGS
jgi:hypothetical protein